MYILRSLRSKIKVYNLKTGKKPLYTLENLTYAEKIYSMKLSRDCKTLAVVASYQIRNRLTKEEIHRLVLWDTKVHAIKKQHYHIRKISNIHMEFSPKDKYLLVCLEDEEVAVLWDLS